MGPIVGTAVPRRPAELSPPCLSKDVPHDLSLRNLIPCSRFSASLASFSSCNLANSAYAASFSLFMVSRSALKAATSSDTDIILSLAYCPSPSALSQLYSPPLFRSPMATVPASPHSLYPSPLAVPVPSLVTVPAIKIMYVARPTHSSNANTHCQHQARYIVLGCGYLGVLGSQCYTRPRYWTVMY